MALRRFARVVLSARLRASFGAMWAWRRHQQTASVLGHHSPSASPRALPTRCRFVRSSFGTRSESGGDADMINGYGGRARGPTESNADARDVMSSPIL